MTCRELSDFLLDYVSGALVPEERARFEEHLGECDDCVVYLRTYEETIKLGRGAFAHPDDPVPEDVPGELLRAILAARGKR